MHLEPGTSVIYMKVGTHAQENLSDILVRKQQEIIETGYSMWGYGGNTCHPTTMVQPFAKASAGQTITLCMQPMQSRHFAEPLRAEDFSVDGLHWNPIPSAINVLGSRYALCISSLEEVDETLDLAGTRVAVGNSRGLNGEKYVRGRVDKACLEVVRVTSEAPKPVKIGAIAQLVEPYAVLLRS